MKPHDLIATARRLAQAGGKRPRQADLRRALSTAYYAMFHALALTCADQLIGTSKSSRSNPAWRQVYRGLEHGFAKNACKNKEILKKFPAGIVIFADNFRNLQERRHLADYEPAFRLVRSEVDNDINVAEAAIGKISAESPKDRRAFAAYVLLKTRD